MKDLRNLLSLSLMVLAGISCVWQAGAETPWSQRAADAAIARWPQGKFVAEGQRWVWNYELGTLLEGFDAVWMNTADPRYYDYIKASVDPWIGADGSIATYKPEENQLDNILLGRQLLLLYGVTLDKRYAVAAGHLYDQLRQQPRTASGGFWHKQRYPNQMWLDGLYMAEPFYAEYAATFHHPEAFKEIDHQFALIDEHLRDPKTGLLYHGWDESKQERWADPVTGVSKEFWGRAMGWTMMALVDTLEYLPADDPGRQQLIAQLNRYSEALVRVQDKQSGLWFQVLDKPAKKGNYLESSASSMFVYAMARGVRQGYLPAQYATAAARGYQGILTHFIETNGSEVTLTQTVRGAGLGGDPYRDGTFAYYVGEKVASNDPKGVGAFLLAAVEMENAAGAKLGQGKTVMMDAWFNSQMRPDAFDQPVSFHYKWNDLSNSGFSLLGHVFENQGAALKTLYTAPTVKALSAAQVYLIVSPDIPVKNPHPNYMTKEDADQIEAWVKAGGVLVILENDPGNADIDHLNLLSERFGIHYNSVLRNTVEGRKFEQGAVEIPAQGAIFKAAHHAYLKEICTITPHAPAVAQLIDKGDTLIATAKVGKGTVFATVDPWFYNEYLDGRKLPMNFDNYAAARELAHWLLEQAK
jgi:unsaturated rhamnogalacturonyl hydrolase